MPDKEELQLRLKCAVLKSELARRAANSDFSKRLRKLVKNKVVDINGPEYKALAAEMRAKWDPLIEELRAAAWVADDNLRQALGIPAVPDLQELIGAAAPASTQG